MVDYTYDLVQKNSALLTKIVFEQAEDILINGKNVGRIYDIAIDGIKYELKNWSQFFPSTIKTQFIRDLSNIDNLAQLKWVFNKTGGMPDIGTLKTKVMKALKKADGTPVDALIDGLDDKIVKKLFPADKLIDEHNYAQRLLINLSNNSNFSQIFKVVK